MKSMLKTLPVAAALLLISTPAFAEGALSTAPASDPGLVGLLVGHLRLALALRLEAREPSRSLCGFVLCSYLALRASYLILELLRLRRRLVHPGLH